MADRSVELTVAGTKCRVVTTANSEELDDLARMVEEKLVGVVKPGRPVSAQSMLLAAIALANDVQEQRARAERIASSAKQSLTALRARVDGVLATEPMEPAESSRGSRRGKPAADQRIPDQLAFDQQAAHPQDEVQKTTPRQRRRASETAPSVNESSDER